jgi:hypothetical protein
MAKQPVPTRPVYEGIEAWALSLLGKQKGSATVLQHLSNRGLHAGRARSKLIPNKDGKRQRDPSLLAAGGYGMSTPRVALVDSCCMVSIAHHTPSGLDPKKAPQPPAPPTNKIPLQWPPDCLWPFTNDIEGQGPADSS